MTIWVTVIAAGVGCYLLKLAGVAVPSERLPGWLARTVALAPVALLAALVAVQATADGQRLVADPRLVGLAAGAIALLLRAPFAVVLIAAAVSAAGAHVLLS
jgi:branched-subunit amino acid transport protein